MLERVKTAAVLFLWFADGDGECGRLEENGTSSLRIWIGIEYVLMSWNLFFNSIVLG